MNKIKNVIDGTIDNVNQSSEALFSQIHALSSVSFRHANQNPTKVKDEISNSYWKLYEHSHKYLHTISYARCRSRRAQSIVKDEICALAQQKLLTRVAAKTIQILHWRGFVPESTNADQPSLQTIPSEVIAAHLDWLQPSRTFLVDQWVGLMAKESNAIPENFPHQALHCVDKCLSPLRRFVSDRAELARYARRFVEANDTPKHLLENLSGLPTFQRWLKQHGITVDDALKTCGMAYATNFISLLRADSGRQIQPGAGEMLEKLLNGVVIRVGCESRVNSGDSQWRKPSVTGDVLALIIFRLQYLMTTFYETLRKKFSSFIRNYQKLSLDFIRLLVFPVTFFDEPCEFESKRYYLSHRYLKQALKLAYLEHHRQIMSRRSNDFDK